MSSGYLLLKQKAWHVLTCIFPLLLLLIFKSISNSKLLLLYMKYWLLSSYLRVRCYGKDKNNVEEISERISNNSYFINCWSRNYRENPFVVSNFNNYLNSSFPVLCLVSMLLEHAPPMLIRSLTKWKLSTISGYSSLHLK